MQPQVKDKRTGMKILVCVKQVPDSADTLSISDSSPEIRYDPSTVFRMNRYDEFAVEEALRIKELFPESSIGAVSVGPHRVEKTIQKALEMGVDHGVHIRFDSDEYILPSIRASLIFEYARSKDYDLILTGVMAEDDMECQVGQILAEMLCLPCATSVIHIDISINEETMYVEREIEGGVHECLALTLPALLTIQSGMNTPRYPSLSNVLRARTQELEHIETLQSNNMLVSQNITGLCYPEEGSFGEFLEGTPEDKARALMNIFHKISIL